MTYHRPIMVKEIIEILQPRSKGVHVDGTVGGGGHALAVAEKMDEDGLLIAIDRDGEALQHARGVLADVRPRVEFVRGDWRNVHRHLEELGVGLIDSALLDLGVSSHQLDTPRRGFSYADRDAPLDMRMDMDSPLSASDVVNDYSEGDLTRIIAIYGEERWASRIAKFIVCKRPMYTVGELVDTIKAAIPASARRDGPHPARRTFQALRMEVNRELEAFEEGLMDFVESLTAGGRMAVITFHSLEDRPVKRLFRYLSRECRCPPQLPVCACGGPVVHDLTRHPVTPSDGEVLENPRSRSAKLRAIELIRDASEVLRERRESSRWQ
ncbi:MAG: 16S rRNA (cytosine(1402)-N(4))-methyltransferase RsmH [Bacillota bacterium]